MEHEKDTDACAISLKHPKMKIKTVQEMIVKIYSSDYLTKFF